MHGAHKHTAAGTTTNANWWPNQLNLKILHQHSPLSNPMDKEFNYAQEFKSLDLNAVVGDLWKILPRLTSGDLLCLDTRTGW